MDCLEMLSRKCADVALYSEREIHQIHIGYHRSINDLRRDKARFRLNHDIAGMRECDSEISRIESELEPQIETVRLNAKTIIDGLVKQHQKALAKVNVYDLRNNQ